MTFDKAMMAALAADGEKLRQLTGEDHGPYFPIWGTVLPFEIAPGDGALLAKALKAYRPETSEEEGIVNFFIEQFGKLDSKPEPTL